MFVLVVGVLFSKVYEIVFFVLLFNEVSVIICFYILSVTV
jgi:hypothetical protein